MRGKITRVGFASVTSTFHFHASVAKQDQVKYYFSFTVVENNNLYSHSNDRFFTF